ncbi:MAG: HIT family protein [Bacteroidales bacterium]|nr:HIT family protein [Bacteroidales bacterium]
MATIFTRIAKGEIPSFKVAESGDYYAFLDISPMAPGHTLVIPKNVENDYIFALEPDVYAGLWDFASKVAKAIGKALPCKRVGVAVLGMEVPHTHIHLVPLQSEADMDFRKPKLSLPKEEMAQIAAKINAEYEKLK